MDASFLSLTVFHFVRYYAYPFYDVNFASLLVLLKHIPHDRVSSILVVKRVGRPFGGRLHGFFYQFHFCDMGADGV